MTRIPQLQEQLVQAAARSPHERMSWVPKFGRRRYLAIALAALVVAGGSAGAAKLVIHEGKPIPPAPAADFTPKHHMVPPIRGTEHIVATSPDPGGGLPWGLRVSRGKQGTVCTGIGQVLHGRLGSVDYRKVFHKLPLLGPDTCNPPTKSDDVGWGMTGVGRRTVYVVYGTAGTQVMRLVVTAPGLDRTLQPSQGGGFIVALPRPVSFHDVTVTAHFRDGSVQAFGGGAHAPKVDFAVTRSGVGRKASFTVSFNPPFKADDPRDSYRAVFYLPSGCRGAIANGRVEAPAGDVVHVVLKPGAEQRWCRGRYKGSVTFIDFQPGVKCGPVDLKADTCSRERPVGRFFTFLVR